MRVWSQSKVHSSSVDGSDDNTCPLASITDKSNFGWPLLTLLSFCCVCVCAGAIAMSFSGVHDVNMCP